MNLMSSRLMMMAPLVTALSTLNCSGDGDSSSTADAAAGTGGTGASNSFGTGGTGMTSSTGGTGGSGMAGEAGEAGMGGMTTGGTSGMGGSIADAGADSSQAGMGGIVSDAGQDAASTTALYKLALFYTQADEAGTQLINIHANNLQLDQFVGLTFADSAHCELVNGVIKHNQGESNIVIGGQSIDFCQSPLTLELAGGIFEGASLVLEKIIVSGATRDAWSVTGCTGLGEEDCSGQLEEMSQ